MENIPLLERVKISTELLLPFYKKVCDEVGTDRAKQLLRTVVKEHYVGMGGEVAKSVGGAPLDSIRSLVPVWKEGEALKIENVADNDSEFSMNVRGCQYAEYFRSIGEPEFGAMITCECDAPLTDGIGGGIEMERTQTILGGASHCDFRWKQK